MDKPKVAIDYSKLTPELLDLFDETYPSGVAGHTIRFPNSKGEIVTSVRLETEDKIYLVKLSARPKEILTEEDLDALVRPSAKDSEMEEEEDSNEEEDDAPNKRRDADEDDD